MKRETKLGNIIIFTILLIGSVVMIAPLVWMLSTAFKERSSVFALPPEWIPNPITFEPFQRLLEIDTLWSGIRNSIIVSLSVTIIGSFTSSLAAFSFAKLRLPFKNLLFLLLLGGIMIPYPSIMIPQFAIFSRIGWVDTLLPLIVPGLFGNIIMVFFLKQYLSNIPDSIVEAAKIDGAGYFEMFYKLIVPVIRPAIAAQFILWFMTAWNDYLAPLLYLRSPDRLTLQVVIANLNATYAIQTDYPLIMAASVISLLPVLIIFMIFQKQIIENVALSGVKG